MQAASNVHASRHFAGSSRLLDDLGKGLGLQPGSHTGTSGFFVWHSKKLGKNTVRGDNLLLAFGDEQTAFKELARLYREYAELEEG